MTSPSPNPDTYDAFLGGRFHLWQPRHGYRAGIDAVLLAAACPAAAGQSVLELGCGAGAAALCLSNRVAGLYVNGVERNPGMASYARRNGLEVVEADIAALPLPLRDQSFDHVIANPPYYRRNRGSAAPEPLREDALGEDIPLPIWLETARRRLHPGGWLTLIHQAERLSDILRGLDGFGNIRILPIAPRSGRPARLIIVQARKASAGVLQLLAPLILHEGTAHERDGEDYRPEISAVLRSGSPLPGLPPI